MNKQNPKHEAEKHRNDKNPTHIFYGNKIYIKERHKQCRLNSSKYNS